MGGCARREKRNWQSLRVSPFPGKELEYDPKWDGPCCCIVPKGRFTNGWRDLFKLHNFWWSQPHQAWILDRLEGGARLTVDAAFFVKKTIESVTMNRITVSVRDEHPSRAQAS